MESARADSEEVATDQRAFIVIASAGNDTGLPVALTIGIGARCCLRICVSSPAMFAHAFRLGSGKVFRFTEIIGQVEQLETLIGVIINQLPITAAEGAAGAEAWTFARAVMI